MHSPGEDAADDHPQKRDGTVQRTQNGAENRAKTGNVQKLDQEDLGRAHFHIVHAVRHFAGGRRTVGIRAEHFLHKSAVDKIPREKAEQSQNEIHP